MLPKFREIIVRMVHNLRSKNIPISGNLIKEKAQYFALQFGHEDYVSSDVWVTSLKKDVKYFFKTICGESKSVRIDVVQHKYEDILQNYLKVYSPDCIYNADETGLFYKLLPNKTLTYKGDRCIRGKKSKERVTILSACNISGSDKLPLLLILKI